MELKKINEFYNKNYKLILLLPLLIILISLAYLGYFYSQNNDFVHRDISLTGGTTITILSNISSEELQTALAEKIPNMDTRALLDNSGKQTQIIIITSEEPELVTPILEDYFGFKLDETNTSVEFIGSSLSADFYKQLGITVLIAFFWMAAVVFVIFAKKWKLKFIAILLNLLFGIFLGKMFFSFPIYISLFILATFIITLIFIYLKYSIPSFAVMLCAFADIIMTLAVVDIIGMKVAGAGIVAFLMLIGYSVDTDILLTTRVLTRKDSPVNHEIFSAFKTGITMTLTAIAAIAVALFFVRPFGTVLNQMFIILLIGLTLDIFNTWITNTCLIKWFAERTAEESRL